MTRTPTRARGFVATGTAETSCALANAGETSSPSRTVIRTGIERTAGSCPSNVTDALVVVDSTVNTAFTFDLLDATVLARVPGKALALADNTHTVTPAKQRC